jgi:hypothetical protein
MMTHEGVELISASIPRIAVYCPFFTSSARSPAERQCRSLPGPMPAHPAISEDWLRSLHLHSERVPAPQHPQRSILGEDDSEHRAARICASTNEWRFFSRLIMLISDNRETYFAGDANTWLHIMELLL